MDPYHQRLQSRNDENVKPGSAWQTVPSYNNKTRSFGGNNGNDSVVPAVSSPVGNFRDWEGLAYTHEMNQLAFGDASKSSRNNAPSFRPPAMTAAVVARTVDREGSPSVAIFAEANKRAHQAIKHPEQFARGTLVRMNRDTGDVQALVDHQTFLAWKRAEYARRLQCEERGETFVPQTVPFSQQFAKAARDGARNGYDADASIRSFGTAIDVDFHRRSKQVLVPQVVGTPEEVAWLQRPVIPQPTGWSGTWDTCPGHEVLLQLLAVSGATPANSPALTRHLMYPDLLSCVQRLTFGNYMVLYDRPGEPPHERYFYIKSLPLANRSQYCPFLCYSTHRRSTNAIDAVPLCNVMWVTPGVHTSRLKRYQVAEESRYIYGPMVGKKRAEMLNYGAFSVWVYMGDRMKSIDVIATDPLQYEMWLTLLDNVAQTNASLDLGNRVRTVQRYIEELKCNGNLHDLKPDPEPGYFERYFGRNRGVAGGAGGGSRGGVGNSHVDDSTY